jgi:hypothetical protein
VRRPGHKTSLLLFALLAALLVAGCGGGGGDETTETAATTEEPQKLSKAELIEQGDGVCAETNAAVGALSGAETEASSSEQDEKVANLYTGMIERLQELGAPEGAESAYSEFAEAGEELAKVEGEVKLAAEREDTPTLEEAKIEAAPQLEEFQERAADYGFEDCSEGPGAVTPASPGAGSAAPEAGGEELEGSEEEGGVEPEAEYVEPEYEEAPPEEEAAPETGGAGGGAEVAPEGGGETGGGGSESGGVGPG